LPTSDAESEAVTPSPDAFFDGTALGREATVGPLDDDARAEVGTPSDASARDAASEQGIPVLADVRAPLIDASTDAYLDRVPPVDAGLDAALGDATSVDVFPGPHWLTLGDLSEHIVLAFSLQFAGGTPFIGMSKLTPPGRARVTIAFRYDGAAWQKLGTDLPGSEALSFTVASDGTPYAFTSGTIRAFQQGQWVTLPDAGNGFAFTTLYPAIAVDRSDRLHALVVDSATGAPAVVRFNGLTWDLLGPRNALGPTRYPTTLAFDSQAPYIAVTNTDTFQIEVRRFNGSDWVQVGGASVPWEPGDFAVSRDGNAYVTTDSAGLIETVKASAAPWMDVDRINAYAGNVVAAPALDLAFDDTLYIAYLADHDPGSDVVPGPLVSRFIGSHFQELTTQGLDPSLFDSIRLKVAHVESRDVPYIAYVRANSLVVKKLE